MSLLGDILKAAIERSQKANSDQLEHVKEQGDALAANARKPLWKIRVEQIKAALAPPKESDE